MLGAIERGCQIGKTAVATLRAAFQRPAARIVAGDREAMLRSQACHPTDPCPPSANGNTAADKKVRSRTLLRIGKRTVNNAVCWHLFDAMRSVSLGSLRPHFGEASKRKEKLQSKIYHVLARHAASHGGS